MAVISMPAVSLHRALWLEAPTFTVSTAVVQSGIVRHTVKFDECSVILCCYKIVFYLGR